MAGSRPQYGAAIRFSASGRGPKTPAHPKVPFTSVEKGCPWDCGLCPEHRQHTCTALIEVTQRCNLRCAFCFANAGTGDSKDPDLHTIKLWYERLLSAGGPYNIQLSGGEPTLREDLPEIIALGRSLGFSFIQVNTNGLRLAERKSYAKELKDAGAASIFLQFDGIGDPTYKTLRGRPLFHEKKLALEHCAEYGLGAVLVPTLVPGVNIHEIGAYSDDLQSSRCPRSEECTFSPLATLEDTLPRSRETADHPCNGPPAPHHHPGNHKRDREPNGRKAQSRVFSASRMRKCSLFLSRKFRSALQWRAQSLDHAPCNDLLPRPRVRGNGSGKGAPLCKPALGAGSRAG